MARLIRIPYLASLLVVSDAREIDDLIDHPALDRSFRRQGGLVNRLLVAALDRQIRLKGNVLAAFRPRGDAERVEGQRQLFAQLDRLADAAAWPPAPVEQMARFVATGRERRDALAALAYAITLPFLGSAAATQDDAYKPQGRHLWRLHRRTALARRPGSPTGWLIRLTGANRRARNTILDLVGGRQYGLHAVEITLANAHAILEAMRRALESHPAGAPLTGRQLAWAAIRTAPETVVRQTVASITTLPHVGERVPANTLVLLAMRRGLEPDSPSGYEFASGHWSACPARRFVMGLFAAVAAAALEQSTLEQDTLEVGA